MTTALVRGEREEPAPASRWTARQSGYAGSKAALNMMAAYMADEYATIGVRSNVLAPARFPDVVPVECVAELVARLDGETCTGRTVVLDSRGAVAVASDASGLDPVLPFRR